VDDSCPHLYVVRVLGGQRDRLLAFLQERGIGTGVHYIPNHLQPAFARFRTCLPVTEAAFDQILTLPLFNSITDAEVDEVIGAVLEFFGV
jgi:perosamine synthetase